MPELSRRAFLIRSSMGAAAVAIGSAVPGLPGLIGTAEEEAPSVDDSAVGAAGVQDTSEPLIAHVTDLRSGEMNLYLGERQFSVTDPGLAARLFGAAR